MKREMQICLVVWLCAALVSACGAAAPSASDVATDAGAVDAAGVDVGDAGGETAAGDAAGAESLGGVTSADIGDTPPTVAFVSPAPDTVVELGQAVTLTAHVADPYLAPTQLSLALTLTTGPLLDAPDLAVGADGTLTVTLTTLPPGHVTLELVALDGQNAPAIAQLPLFVHTIPGAPHVVILPASPTNGDDLHAVVDVAAVDADGTPIGPADYVYAWSHDGIAVDAHAATLGADWTLPGQVWTAQVRANALQTLGKSGFASVQVGNAPLTPPVVALAPDSPTVASTLICTTSAQAANPDGGDALGFSYAWTLNGNVVKDVHTAAWQLAKKVDGKWTALASVHVGDAVGCAVVVSDSATTLPAVQATPVTLGAFNSCVDGSPCALFADCSPSDSVTPSCTCQTGFGGDGVTCADVDECADVTAVCAPPAECSNTFGGYSCSCPAGYTGDGSACVDVDECSTGTAVCDPNASCGNTPGGYTCTCNNGWIADGAGACSDIDECSVGGTACDPHAECANLPGTYACVCLPGWVTGSDVNSCVDVNECATPTTCGANATCTNTDGGYWCACDAGFTTSANGCADLNECTNGTAVCDPNATCINDPGTYHCTCLSGYSGDGITCLDIDECAEGLAQCDPAATCSNEPGSFFCACKVGYIGDGKTCTPKP